jgi:DNA-binding response OmpR family regulator
VVEDEPAIADLIAMSLERSGYRPRCVASGETALSSVASEQPDVIILDVGLPGIDGLEVCRRLRAADDWTPIIFVTARDDEVDRVLGLELGADDYVTKPFSPRELVARVATILRRSSGPPRPGAAVDVGDVHLDPGARRVFAGEREVVLTATEFELLWFLMRRPGWVFTRDQLLNEVWGYSMAGGTRTVDVHVAQLRSKLGSSSVVRTVRGVGYSVEAPRAGPGPTGEPGCR